MKAIIVSLFLCFSFIGHTSVLYMSTFSRLNNTDFRVLSYFSSGSGLCWPYQTRFEHLSNDTLYLELIYETRLAAPALGCNRADTMTQTNMDPGIHYINVSTGIITFDSTDNTIGDTLWSMFDSTFNAVLGLSDFSTNGFELSYAQNQLTVNGKKTIEQIEVIDLSGQQVMLQSGNKLDVSRLMTGVYLLRLFSASGGTIVRWYRE